jgi:hypothetical protein
MMFMLSSSRLDELGCSTLAVELAAGAWDVMMWCERTDQYPEYTEVSNTTVIKVKGKAAPVTRHRRIEEIEVTLHAFLNSALDG